MKLARFRIPLRLFGWKITERNRFRLEITVIVLLKLILLYTAKRLWFSEPVAHHMRVEPQRIEQQFFGPSADKPHSVTGAPS
ncbi:hypothetical protein FNU76_16970 [Chitinimonas arctica]|uniref:Uncharacterized protein n=1 Tax=Chitinimonas arctica TaxID=2594795 RepID=A0A516SIC2_9NEIS|nr:cytochrome oxidase putative small subunit CydP [Chitinimonas arctica]QDQ27900.1 hypothetical protein FNU76_16970 [Chitinimonas arctica]